MKTIAATQMPAGQLDNLMSVAYKVGHCVAERLEAVDIEALNCSYSEHFFEGEFFDCAGCDSEDCDQFLKESFAVLRSEVAKFGIALPEVWFGAESGDSPLFEVACHMSQVVGDTVLIWAGSLANLLIV
jgi:hypothetical protein